MMKHAFLHMYGLGDDLPEMPIFEIFAEDEILKMNLESTRLFGANKVLRTYELKIPDILSLEIRDVETDKEKSGLGSMIVGGLIAGETGALLGGLSAAGEKKKKNMLIIQYLPSTGNQHKTLVFNMEFGTWFTNNLSQYNKLKKHIKKIPKSPRAQEYLGIGKKEAVEFEEGGTVQL